MKFTIVSGILGSSGYDIHGRELTKALSKIADVKLNTQIQAGQEKDLTDKEVELIKKPDDIDRIRIIITNPMHWRVNATSKRNWVYMIWEGDKIPKSFIKECLNPDIEFILVPSIHTRDAISNTFEGRQIGEGLHEEVMNKVKIIPHGVDLDKFYPKDKPEKFRFVANKGFRHLEDRGGIQYLLQAYIEEFNQNDQVELMIKLNPAYGIPDMNKIVKDLGHTDKSASIMMTTNQVPHSELNNIYNSGHVFVSPTRAESFGIPMIEAGACNLMTLTTGYGGQTDFIKDGENGLLIDYDMTEVVWELLYEGTSWATPKIEDLRKKMRWCYENPDKVKEMGKKAGEIAKEFTWDNSSKKLLALVDR